jgi:hypothetical protein
MVLNKTINFPFNGPFRRTLTCSARIAKCEPSVLTSSSSHVPRAPAFVEYRLEYSGASPGRTWLIAGGDGEILIRREAFRRSLPRAPSTRPALMAVTLAASTRTARTTRATRAALARVIDSCFRRCRPVLLRRRARSIRKAPTAREHRLRTRRRGARQNGLEPQGAALDADIAITRSNCD